MLKADEALTEGERNEILLQDKVKAEQEAKKLLEQEKVKIEVCLTMVCCYCINGKNNYFFFSGAIQVHDGNAPK